MSPSQLAILGSALLASCTQQITLPCVPQDWYIDEDGDGYGADSAAVRTCEAPPGHAAAQRDCDDGDPSIHPCADEICDGLDQDCDGLLDELFPTESWYPDRDGDGYGGSDGEIQACFPPAGHIAEGGDCDDGDPEAHPGADETWYDGVDADCDGASDYDADGDGYDSQDHGGGDCDDTNPGIHPGATETCNGRDDDCDGEESACEFSGAQDLAEAQAKHWAASNEDAGRLLDVGDVDADGRQDVLVATLRANSSGGGGYLVYGPLSGERSLGKAGHQLLGSSGSGAGRSIGIGDADGDGYEDVIFGAPWGSSNRAQVVFGPVSDDMELADADVELAGLTGTYCGHGSDLGDVNGDGVADAVIGAYRTSDGGNGSGTVYVVHGPLGGRVSLASEADATLIGQSAGDYTGRAIRAGADVNGDGIGDMLIPATYASYGGNGSGAAYVVFGPVSGSMDLGAADVFMVGESAGDYAGCALAMGDVNGDGLGDVAVGSYGNAGGSRAGAAHVVFGPGSASLDLGAADLIVRGIKGSLAGSGLAIGDTDGDEACELLVGAPYEASNGAYTGAAYLFYGPLSGSVDTADAQAWALGESASDFAGQGLAIGDLDGDGWGELLIGAPGEATGGSSAGAVYALTPSM